MITNEYFNDEKFWITKNNIEKKDLFLKKYEK